ncbi:transmembrane 4 L6 family member 5-like [Rhinophrynus dorsalis]
MCTGKCSKFIGVALYPFAVICIICNILLFFPGWSTDSVKDIGEKLTPEVVYLGGIIGGGVLVLIPAIHIQATGKKGCCNNRCGMFLSILFAAIGCAGGVYSLAVSILGMVYGPVCEYSPSSIQNITTTTDTYAVATTPSFVWGRPFQHELENFNDQNYLFNKDLWNICENPKGVTEFNIILFSIILAASAIEVVLCAVQIINGLMGCLCGTCQNKD